MKVLGPSYHNTKEKIVKMFNAEKVDATYYDLTPDHHAVLWFPVMKAKVYNGWNYIGFHENEAILEYNSNDAKQQEHLKKFAIDSDFDQIRFAFSKLNGDYHFLGIYQLDREDSLRIGKCIWRRMCHYYVILPGMIPPSKKKSKNASKSTKASEASEGIKKKSSKSEGNSDVKGTDATSDGLMPDKENA